MQLFFRGSRPEIPLPMRPISARSGQCNPVVTNAISVDVEDHFHTEMMSRHIPRSHWNSLPCRVEQSTEVLLDEFAANGVRGTFFFLGWVAERFPGLVRRAVESGHEVGCHSYWHRRVCTLSPADFREDTIRAKHAIEDAAGVEVYGYRAPSFSITPGAEWAFQILAELGFRYDSSIHPIRHGLYGNPGAPRKPFRHEAANLLEIPISTLRLLGTNLPFSGGGYFRLFPYSMIRWGIDRINKEERMPVLFYLHPWEIDTVRPRLGANWKTIMRQYIRTGNTLDDLGRMLGEFRFAPICEIYGDEFLPESETMSEVLVGHSR